MILSLFRTSKANGSVSALYCAIVAQSRRPELYATVGIPDTMTGRFDMVCLHMALVLRRLRREGGDTRAFSQALFDYFFKDMDRTLREAGVGDLSVGKKIGKMGEVFYGLLANLTQALEEGDGEDLKAVLARNFFEDETVPGLDALADYVSRNAGSLAAQPVDAILAGEPAFAAPPQTLSPA